MFLLYRKAYLFNVEKHLSLDELQEYLSGVASQEQLLSIEKKLASESLFSEAAEGYLLHPGALDFYISQREIPFSKEITSKHHPSK